MPMQVLNNQSYPSLYNYTIYGLINNQQLMCSISTLTNTGNTSEKMSSLTEILKYTSDLPVLRRILCAATYLPPEMPKYWDAIAQFCCTSSKMLETSQVKTLVENIRFLRFLNQTAFARDDELLRELYKWDSAGSRPTGVILISPKTVCGRCGAKLFRKRTGPALLLSIPT